MLQGKPLLCFTIPVRSLLPFQTPRRNLLIWACFLPEIFCFFLRSLSGDLVAFLQVWTSLVRTDRSLFTEARLQFFSGVLKAVRIFAGKALGVSVSSYMEKREERKKLLKLGAGPLSLNG
uniref:Uncharacterized protein n=1 Tax=Zea mays TaxID=4577 RepID=A0A804R781_MAIZE